MNERDKNVKSIIDEVNSSLAKKMEEARKSMKREDEFKKRKGILIITEEQIRFDGRKILNEILSKVLVVRAENYFHNRTLKYIGYSDCFNSVEWGTIPPRYKVIKKDNKYVIVKDNLRED